MSLWFVSIAAPEAYAIALTLATTLFRKRERERAVLVPSMLDYDFPLYRPPSEGSNLIVQVTLGCSFNHCSFCSMYREKTFQVRPLEEVYADIARAARLWPEAHRVFLADGDAYILPTEHLLALCHRLRQSFPHLQRIAAYATPIALLRKTPDEIAALRAERLSLV